MTGQKKRHSLLESLINIAIGYNVALLTQIIVFPFFGIHIELHTNIAIGIVFTVVSLVRSYSVRRLFNWLHGTGKLQ